MLISGAAGILVWFPLNALNQLLGNAPNDSWSLWYGIGYPALLALAAILGYLAPGRPAGYGPLAVLASYGAALFLVPQTGNLLPFELLWMCLLSLPAAWLGKAGAGLHQK